MGFNTGLMGQIDLVVGLNNVDLNTSVTSDYISLKNWHGCLVVWFKVVGTAGDDPSIQMFQAQDVAATGEKALTFSRLWYKLAALQSSIGTFTQVVLTTATADLDLVSVNGADLLSDVAETMVVLDIPSDSLDVTNGFDCICFKNDGADLGNAALGSVLFIPYGPRQAGNVPLSSIID